MKLPLSRMLVAGLAAPLLAACVHTPPGTSVELALAKRPEVVRLPAHIAVASRSPDDRRSRRRVTASSGRAKRPAAKPAVARDNKAEHIAEALTRARFCVEGGKDLEAIAAFEEAVKLDSSLTDAWNTLAVLYEKTGQGKKSLEAFRKSKEIARH